MGCTEPACAALCAAAAAGQLSGEVAGISMVVNPGLYKNGMSVAIPGFDRVGMDYAAALGALIGDTSAELQIFEGITPLVATRAHELVESGAVRVSVDYERKGIYARCDVTAGEDTARAVIEGAHTNVVLVSHNGQVCFQKDVQAQSAAADPAAELRQMTIAQISWLVDGMDPADLDWLVDGARANSDVAAYGTQNPSPVGIAAALSQDFRTSEADQMMSSVGAAIESRLDGCPRAVTSSAGAGSKGLALTIPLTVAAERAGSSRQQLARALAFGHLVNSYINAVIGKLSAVCTCAAAASTAASAALVKLWGGSEQQMGFAIRNMTGTISGMICDGGKTGCAMKLSMATSAAYLCARMAMNGSVLRVSDGICAATPEQCIANIAQVANVGMADVDAQILSIMLAKKAVR
ncbi:MAG: serine dehydratase subunit alpha family protein [Atopobiaceae bacterium]